jgi:hypothetical protein
VAEPALGTYPARAVLAWWPLAWVLNTDHAHVSATVVEWCSAGVVDPLVIGVSHSSPVWLWYSDYMRIFRQDQPKWTQNLLVLTTFAK